MSEQLGIGRHNRDEERDEREFEEIATALPRAASRSDAVAQRDESRMPSVAQERAKRPRKPPPLARGTRRCMVLAHGESDVTAIDTGSGVMVRLRIDAEPEDQPSYAPFDLVDSRWARDNQPADLSQPEAVTVSGTPQVVGLLNGRRARRLLRHVLAPEEQHLLGFAGTSAPYWQFAGTHPSAALVVPSRGPLLFRRGSDGSVWARFGWPRSDNWLPVSDRRAVAALWASRRDRLYGKDLAKALGFKPYCVLVTLTPPREGHCYKTVAAILPRP